MIFYIILFIAILLLAASSIFVEKKYAILIFGFAAFILFMIAAFRSPEVDRDHEDYIGYFNDVIQHNYQLILLEPTYYVISKISALLLNNYYLVFIIYAFLGITIKSIAIKNTSNFLFISLLLYFSNYYFLHEMTQIRIGVAAGLFLYSIQYIKQKRIIPFLLCLLLATTFHYSAIIGVPFFFIDVKKINVKAYTIGFVVCILVFFLKISVLNVIGVFGNFPLFQKINIYKTLIEEGDVTKVNFFNIFSLSFLIFNSLFLWKATYLATKNQYFIIMLKISCFAFFISCVFFDFPAMSFRLSEYLGIVNICLVPMLFYFFKEKVLPVTLLVMYIILVFIVNIYFVKLMLPYNII